MALIILLTLPTVNICRGQNKCNRSYFSILPETISKFRPTFILLSANSYNLDQSKNVTFGKGLNLGCMYWGWFLSFGKGLRLVKDPLTHYQTTNFRLFQIERLYRWQFKIWRKSQKAIQTGRKHCGKRRNCSLRAISPFPTVFSKGLFPRGVKRCHCLGMG